jgi:hypothetical protein
MIFFYYLLIGAIFTLFLDLISDYLQTEAKFSNLERIVVILLWPISMVIFFYEFFKIKRQ